MVSETMSAILKSELQAEDRLELKRKEAEGIIKKAAADAAELKEAAKEKAVRNASELQTENKRKIKEIYELYERATQESVSEMIVKAKDFASDAEKFVIEKLIS